MCESNQVDSSSENTMFLMQGNNFILSMALECLPDMPYDTRYARNEWTRDITDRGEITSLQGNEDEEDHRSKKEQLKGAERFQPNRTNMDNAMGPRHEFLGDRHSE